MVFEPGAVASHSRTFHLYLHMKTADWLLTTENVRLTGKHFLTEVGKMDDTKFRVEVLCNPTTAAMLVIDRVKGKDGCCFEKKKKGKTELQMTDTVIWLS